MATPIMGPASATCSTVAGNARKAGATPWFILALDAIWIQCPRVGVDPVVAAAQCAHETGLGRFSRAVTPSHGNLAGIKIRDVPAGAPDDSPDIHARFAIDPYGRPLVGALAQAHHLALYSGRHVPFDTPDPRAVHVWPGSAAFGSAPTVEQLGGRWAPAPDYGTRVAAMAARLRAPLTP